MTRSNAPAAADDLARAAAPGATAGATAGTRTVGAALSETTARLMAAGCVSAAAEARWLLEEVLDLRPGTVASRRREPLPASAARALEGMVERRVAGEPLQYVVGWAPFGHLRVRVGPGVFVPRPETELVAERAAAHLRLAAERHAEQVAAVDLCTGSGAIAMFVADAVPSARVLATEVDPGALEWAARNLEGTRVELLAGDLDRPLPDELRSRVDLIVTNVPYVPTPAMDLLPRDVREHEPMVSLDGGPDGLDVLRRVVAGAGTWLVPGGWLVAEIGDDQGEPASALLTDAGFADVAVLPDLTGRTRVLDGRWPA
jgi:release factor glutamine methyltransferase